MGDYLWRQWWGEQMSELIAWWPLFTWQEYVAVVLAGFGVWGVWFLFTDGRRRMLRR